MNEAQLLSEWTVRFESRSVVMRAHVRILGHLIGGKRRLGQSRVTHPLRRRILDPTAV